MTRMATLIISGTILQTLEAVIAHRIYNARSMVEDRNGLRSDSASRALTKVTIDGDRYRQVITSWLTEPIKQPLEPGTLLRARWCCETLAGGSECGILRDRADRRPHNKR